MNFAHVHLILNHIPMMTMPIALIFFCYAVWTRSENLKRFSLIILLGTSATVVPTYLTGEPAEEIVERIAGVSEQLIKAHEESAEISLILTLITGAIALFSILFGNKPKLQKVSLWSVLTSTALSVGSLGYTANLGGKIRHSEILSSVENTSPTNSEINNKENDNS